MKKSMRNLTKGMTKSLALTMALAMMLVMSSCGTYTGSGAYTGSSIGAILGSAVGGISGGGRGADIGTIVGMASGAAVGAAIGQAADKKVEQREADDVHRHYQQVQRNKAKGINPYSEDGKYHPTQQQAQTESCCQSQQEAKEKQPFHFERVGSEAVDSIPTAVIDETNSADDRIEFE